MDQLRRVLEQTWATINRLGPTHRLLVASLAVTVVMALFLVTQYAGRPTLVPLADITPTQHGEAQSVLRRAGIKATLKNGELMVPQGDQYSAVAMLGESRILPDDTSVTFRTLLENQDWKLSREQNQQQFIFALQNELARVIAQMTGIRSAKVMIDAPEPRGFGAAVREPTAAATVFTAGGLPLEQDQVDAIASLVAGARSGLKSSSVTVVNGTTGKRHTVSDPGMASASTYLEHRAIVEKDTRRKIESLLGFIGGVSVAVTAEVDMAARERQTLRHLAPGDGTVSTVSRETTNESEVAAAGNGAEPGVRANTGAAINTGGGSSSPTSTTANTETSFDTRFGSESLVESDPRGVPVYLAASVTVPEGYIRSMLEEESEDGEVARDDVLARFDELKVTIEQTLAPHLRTRARDGTVSDGAVSVALVPGATGPSITGAQTAGLFGGIAGGSSGGGGSFIETGLLAGLAVVSLGLMLMMARRGSKRVKLPTAEELVGIPPALESESDMVGEADESDAALEGLEVDEEAVRKTQMLDQVRELVGSDPDKTAKLLGRWMITDD